MWMVLSLIVLLLGVIVMFGSSVDDDTVEAELFFVWVGGLMAIIGLGGVMFIGEGQGDARDALRASEVFSEVVEANPGCDVVPSIDGREIVITCRKGVE